MVRAHRASPAPSRASAPVVSLDELRQSKKIGIQAHKHARSTRKKYGGELTRMRKWAGAYTTNTPGTVVESSTTPSDNGGVVAVDPEFALAFSGPPKACSADALAMYMTFKCLHQERGQSTAEGARLAVKKYWDELAGDKYRGPWHFDEHKQEWLGSPAMCSDVMDLLKTIKNKCASDGKERTHAVAMKYEHMEKMMAWSRSLVPDEAAYHPPTDTNSLAIVSKHLGFRTFLASGWILWTRNFETSHLQYKHYTPGGKAPPPLCTPYFTMDVRNRKGWQKKLERDKSRSEVVEADLRDNVYHIYPQPKLPAADMFYLLPLWLQYLSTYVYGRALEDEDYLFPTIGANHVVQPLLCISSDTVQHLLDEFTMGSGVAATVRGHFSTHCLRRGGAQYRFILADPEERWNLATTYSWGGWTEGERRDTLIRYLLDEKHLSETSHAHALCPSIEKKPTDDQQYVQIFEKMLHDGLRSLQQEVGATIAQTIAAQWASQPPLPPQSLPPYTLPPPPTPPPTMFESARHCSSPANTSASSFVGPYTAPFHTTAPFHIESVSNRIPYGSTTSAYIGGPLTRAPTVFTYPIVPALISGPHPARAASPFIVPVSAYPPVTLPAHATLPPVLAAVSPMPPGATIVNVPLERDGKRDKSRGWRDVVQLWEVGVPENHIIALKDWNMAWLELPGARKLRTKYHQRRMIALEFINHFNRDDARFLAAYGDAAKCVTHLRDAILKARVERGEAVPRRSKNGSPSERAGMSDDAVCDD